MSLAKFSVNNSVLINMLMIIVFIAGIYTSFKIPKEEAPAVDFGRFDIVVTYRGVSPSEIESQIVDKIEEEISDVSDIKTITSTSSEGYGIISVEMEENADIDKAWNDINTELDKVKDLPSDADDPVVRRINMREVNSICNVVVSGDYSEDALRDIADDLKDELLNVEFVSKIETSGTRDKEILINADIDKLNNYGMTLSDISSAVRNRNINVPGGSISYGTEDYIVRALGEYRSIDEIKNTVLRMTTNGTKIKIKDVATVKDTLVERNTISRLNGKTGATLTIYKKADGNIINVIKDIKKVMTSFQEKIPNLEVELRNDGSEDVKKSMNTLSTNAILGIILVFIVLWLFIGWKNALFAAWGIPFSVLLTFVLMQYFDVTINNLSLFGLILVLGMIVDDAIIVLENIQRHIEMGKSPRQATIEGSKEIVYPVVAAVATTVSAFLPLLLMEGIMGKFLSIFPIVVSLALVSSLIECLIILPSHVAELGGTPTNIKTGKINGANKLSNWFVAKYEVGIKWALGHRGMIMLFLLLATITSGVLVGGGFLTFQFFPKRTARTITLNLKGKIGTPLEETEEIVSGIEQFIFDMPESIDVESVVSTAGQLRENRRNQVKEYYAEIKIDLVDQDDMKFTHDDIKNSIRSYVSKIPKIISFAFKEGNRGGPPVGDDLELRVFGDDFTVLKKIEQDFKGILQEIPGLTDIESTLQDGKKEIQIIPKFEQIEMYGITAADIAEVVSANSYGRVIAKYRGTQMDEVDIRLKAEDFQVENLKDLRKVKLKTRSGGFVALDEIANFVISSGYSEIEHRDRKRLMKITASTTSYEEDGVVKERNASEVTSILRGRGGIKGKLSDFEKNYPGYTLEYGGVAEQQKETYGSLYFAFVLALLFVYTILATQFRSYVQPFIVMMTIPFAIIGIIFGLYVTNLPFSLNTMIAVVALAGIVVNDSLVLVDFVNKEREMGIDRWNSLINAGMVRLRPILMTTVTTIAGFLPMILSTSSATKDWKPMAVSMAFGLGFATLLTLYVIPVIYSYVDSFFGKLKLTRFKSHISYEEAMNLRKKDKNVML